MITSDTRYFCGVIEGFYGRQWGFRQRMMMIDELADAGLNAYMIAPKFDLHHRWNWREPYPADKLEQFRQLCRHGRNRSVSIILSLSPGLSSTPHDRKLLIERFSDLALTEPGGLALLMDDIPYEKADPRAHAEILNSVVSDVVAERGLNWFFCPTAYSTWHLNTWPAAKEYMETIGAAIPDNCQVFWTGQTVISRTIEPDHLDWITRAIRRKPLIWDNFSADDYVPAGMFFPGPITGRSADLPECTSGLMLNPSEIFTASRTAVHSLSEWYRDPVSYSPDRAFMAALRHLSPDPESRLVLQDLFGYFYTPFAIAPEWQDRIERLRSFYLDPSRAASPRLELEMIRQRMRSEQLIDRLPDIWIECYPFVRTLLGDLDYLIRMCRRLEDGESGRSVLPDRDPRWSSPVNDLIRSLQIS